jgi:hypothetical protein
VIGATHVGDAERDRHRLEEGIVGIGIATDIEGELVVALAQRLALEEVGDAAVGIGLGLGDQLGAAVIGQVEERDADAGRRMAPGEVEDVRADRVAGGSHGGSMLPRMADDLTIRVGELQFSARWEPAAPRTRDALRAWLPIRSQLIHCRWSGESTWIPFGDRRPDVGFENHTAHPAPGQILIYVGELSECEILFPYGACSFSSRVGPLAGNHFATLTSGFEHLAEVGRRTLWEGAQEIEIAEAAG